MKQQMMYVSDDGECISEYDWKVIQYEVTKELTDKIHDDHYRYGQVVFDDPEELVHFILKEKELILKVLTND